MAKTQTKISDTPIIDRLCTRASEIPDTNPDNWLLLNSAEIIRDLLSRLNDTQAALENWAARIDAGMTDDELAMMAENMRHIAKQNAAVIAKASE